MTIKISLRAKNVKPSASLAIVQRINELKNQGKEIINLAIGEPDFETPDHIKTAAIQAINFGFTKYTAADGSDFLKEAVLEKFRRENSLTFSRDEIIITSGAKLAFYNLCQTILDKGDEVLIPSPCWVSYPEIVKLAEGKPIFLPTNSASRFKITPEQLEANISPQTKLIIINSPENPTGAVYSQKELAALAEILLQHPQILIASDDIYEHIIWHKEPFKNIVNTCPSLKERTVIINGVSKTYAMTGWRIGYAAGETNIINAMKKIQSQNISCPNSVAEKAAFAALCGDQNCVAIMKDHYKIRHDFLLENLCHIEELNITPADGTFYLFIAIQDAMRKLKCETDLEFTAMLLEKTGVSVLPGTAFGLSDHIRLSFATSMEKIALAVEKINAFLAL